MLYTPRGHQIAVRVEGDRVVLLCDGKHVATMPYQAALKVSRALHTKAKQAEEQAKAAIVAMDSAILLRAGVPLGFSNRPDIQQEAAKEGAWNKDLRRYMPGGVRSKEQFGVPTIRQHPPRKESQNV